MSPIVEVATSVPTNAPVTSCQEERPEDSRPAIIEVSSSAPISSALPKETTNASSKSLITPIESAQSTKSTPPDRPPEQVSPELKKFLSDCPAGAIRCAYASHAPDPTLQTVQFDLSSIVRSLLFPSNSSTGTESNTHCRFSAFSSRHLRLGPTLPTSTTLTTCSTLSPIAHRYHGFRCASLSSARSSWLARASCTQSPRGWAGRCRTGSSQGLRKSQGC
ncbi:hypothetical protein BCR44DRAFT_1441468 [Catenaria anguillulae PL171]|uniref:Uncharacterized protein n=1 Tax=Catenaria anguillulae PL171 TaxID=765915 RepID=A0A1Y2HBA2_9FUNG|nr:hypothetical protein BCR44DRAFT_1441468 [Catenaria anguillulae PL171]